MESGSVLTLTSHVPTLQYGGNSVNKNKVKFVLLSTYYLLPPVLVSLSQSPLSMGL